MVHQLPNTMSRRYPRFYRRPFPRYLTRRAIEHPRQRHSLRGERRPVVRNDPGNVAPGALLLRGRDPAWHSAKGTKYYTPMVPEDVTVEERRQLTQDGAYTLLWVLLPKNGTGRQGHFVGLRGERLHLVKRNRGVVGDIRARATCTLASCMVRRRRRSGYVLVEDLEVAVRRVVRPDVQYHGRGRPGEVVYPDRHGPWRTVFRDDAKEVEPLRAAAAEEREPLRAARESPQEPDPEEDEPSGAEVGGGQEANGDESDEADFVVRLGSVQP